MLAASQYPMSSFRLDNPWPRQEKLFLIIHSSWLSPQKSSFFWCSTDYSNLRDMLCRFQKFISKFWVLFHFDDNFVTSFHILAKTSHSQIESGTLNTFLMHMHRLNWFWLNLCYNRISIYVVLPEISATSDHPCELTATLNTKLF